MYLWGTLTSFLFTSPSLQRGIFNSVPIISTTLSATTTTSTTRQIINDVNQIYEDLSKGCYSVQVTPTIQFKHVSPFSTRAESQNKIVEFQSSEDISSNDVYKLIGDFHEKTKPILLYLPGLDGVGISIASQINDLSEPFELWRMSIDQNDDRSTFTQLTTAVSSFVQDVAIKHDREIILVGESFGGLLAPAVAMIVQNIAKKQDVKNPIIGMVMANPATSFDETQWSTLAPILASLRHVEQEEENSSLPTPYSLIGSLALSLTVPDRTQFQRILDMITNTRVTSLDEAREILVTMFDGFGMVSQNLPAEVIEHRVGQWLPVGCSVVNPRLGDIDIPTLVIASEEDNMLPTKKEGQRLLNAIPNCTTFFVKGSGHFVFDDRFNLTDAIIEAPFDPLRKRKRLPTKEYDPITDWKLPTDEELQETLDKRVKPLRMLTSPKFFSTTADGERVSGLGMIPTTETTGKPLLIVANHQLLGLDLGLIIAELLEERGISARGLAHPIVFQGNGADNGFGPGPRRKVRKVNKDGELEKPLGQFQRCAYHIFFLSFIINLY
jgi:pimeloyl-ACP methyl ester carboxylesterase